ncbi:YezD family protein [Virgibacillus siamensis]|uniref:YezD family protein n=1 Tax=Virgibacillus siamensis TaxID=480071 RepID=UPI001FE3AFE9|nr:YezD family protein [Virgibacillus siamensis]
MNEEREVESIIQQITETLKKLRYGSIVITVHDGEVTQIDTTEKQRFSLTGKHRKQKR